MTLRKPSEITHNGETLSDALQAHALWLRGDVNGKRLVWGYADLRYADLSDANLSDADLSDADLWGADLSDAYLRYADLSDADLWGADLSRADLRYADLSDADLSRADLSRADLRYADLWGARLWGSVGNMREVRSMQIDTWAVTYTADTLQIGCQRHAISKWHKWDTDAGRKWIAQMDGAAAEWAGHNLGLILQIIEANPATPTGHEREDQ